MIRSSYLGRQDSCVPVKKWESEIPINKGSAPPSIKSTQFRLTLACAFTVHEFQGLSLEQDSVHFDLWKQKSLQQGQIYTVLSWVKTFVDLYCIGEFKIATIKVNQVTLLEDQLLKQNDLFQTIKINTLSDDVLANFA